MKIWDSVYICTAQIQKSTLIAYFSKTTVKRPLPLSLMDSLDPQNEVKICCNYILFPKFIFSDYGCESAEGERGSVDPQMQVFDNKLTRGHS